MVDLKELIPGTEHFTWHEALWLPSWGIYHSPSDEEIQNILDLSCKLEKFRVFIDKPFTVECWIRPSAVNCPNSRYHHMDYNSYVGGARASQHRNGSAVDFKITGLEIDQAMLIIAPQLPIFELAAEDNGSSNGRHWIHLQNHPVMRGWCVFEP